MDNDTGGDTSATANRSARGRSLRWPSSIPPAGWWNILVRVWRNVDEHNLAIVAAGQAFFALLAIFPALTLVIALYGLMADPSQVAQQVNAFQGALPEQVRNLLIHQIDSIARGQSLTLNIATFIAFVITFWSASGSIRSLMRALNVAYGERETRALLRFHGTALLLALAIIVLIVLALALIVVLPIVLAFIRIPGWLQALTYILPWCVLAALITVTLGALYRYGPDRARSRWKGLGAGAIAAAVLWLLASALFSIYISKFGSYNATYGSFAAIIILLLWLFLSAFIVLLGAEINAATERQTRHGATASKNR